MARPRKSIDQAQFERLCAILATEEEIASWFDVSVDTVQRFCKRTYKESFAEAYKKRSASGKISIRRKQMEMALNGNVTMLIWLGKQLLGQRDKQEIKTDFVEPFVVTTSAGVRTEMGVKK